MSATKTSTLEFDGYAPDYSGRCEVCSQSPTVDAVLDGKVVHSVGMCGPCTWGEARTIDPETWNEDPDAPAKPKPSFGKVKCPKCGKRLSASPNSLRQHDRDRHGVQT